MEPAWKEQLQQLLQMLQGAPGKLRRKMRIVCCLALVGAVAACDETKSSPAPAGSASATMSAAPAVSLAASARPEHSAAVASAQAVQPPAPVVGTPVFPRDPWTGERAHVLLDESLHVIDFGAQKAEERVTSYGPASNKVEGLARSRDGKRLALTLKGGGIEVWDVPSKKRVQTLESSPLDFGDGVTLSDDGKLVAAGLGDKVVVWEVESAKVLAELEGNNVIDLSFSVDASRLRVASLNEVWVWELATKKLLTRGETTTGGTFPTFLSPRSGHAVASDMAGHELAMYRLAPRFERRKILIKIDDCSEHVTPRFTRDGKLMMGYGALAFVRSFKVPSFEPFTSFKTPPSFSPHHLEMSDNGRLVLLAMSETEAAIWASSPARKQRDLEPSPAKMYRWSFSPQGRWVVASGETELMAWSAQNGRRLKTVQLP